MFPDIEYLVWIDGRPDAVAHDLASSDLRPSTRPDGPIPPRLQGRDRPAATLELLVAETYDVPQDHVLLTAGATTANALAFAVAAETDPAEPGIPLSDDGDASETVSDSDAEPHVLVEKPGYEPLVATPRGFGARVDRFLRPEGILDPSRVAAAAADATTLVAVTDRHNPTGRRTSRDALRETAAAARDVGARLLVDEVYAPFTATPTDGPFGGPTAAHLDGTVVTGSLTKFLGFGGLRVGWLVADPAFVDAAERVQRHAPALADPSVHLARRAIGAHDDLATVQRERVRRNHEHLAAFVADRPRLAGHVHDDSTFALVAHDDLDGDALTARALDADVLVVPGRFFDRPDAVRISLGRPTGEATDALDALGGVLDDV